MIFFSWYLVSTGFTCPFVPYLPAACILLNTYLLINLGWVSSNQSNILMRRMCFLFFKWQVIRVFFQMILGELTVIPLISTWQHWHLGPCFSMAFNRNCRLPFLWPNTQLAVECILCPCYAYWRCTFPLIRLSLAFILVIRRRKQRMFAELPRSIF